MKNLQTWCNSFFLEISKLYLEGHEALGIAYLRKRGKS